MTNNHRDSRFWQQMMKKSPLGVLRHTPPDAGIPVPSDEERKAISDARKRYFIAMGYEQPANEFEAGRRNRDQFNFGHFLERPALEDIIDTSTMDEYDATLMNSTFGDENQADFIIAVTGLHALTYVGAMYEMVVAELNVEGLSDIEYALAVKKEYLAASLIVKLTMDMRKGMDEKRLH